MKPPCSGNPVPETRHLVINMSMSMLIFRRRVHRFGCARFFFVHDSPEPWLCILLSTTAFTAKIN